MLIMILRFVTIDLSRGDHSSRHASSRRFPRAVCSPEISRRSHSWHDHARRRQRDTGHEQRGACWLQLLLVSPATCFVENLIDWMRYS